MYARKKRKRVRLNEDKNKVVEIPRIGAHKKPKRQNARTRKLRSSIESYAEPVLEIALDVSAQYSPSCSDQRLDLRDFVLEQSDVSAKPDDDNREKHEMATQDLNSFASNLGVTVTRKKRQNLTQAMMRDVAARQFVAETEGYELVEEN